MLIHGRAGVNVTNATSQTYTVWPSSRVHHGERHARDLPTSLQMCVSNELGAVRGLGLDEEGVTYLLTESNVVPKLWGEG